MDNHDVSAQIAADLGIGRDLYLGIVESLGREPNFLELQIYSALWSENISYKSSFKWIHSMPCTGDPLVMGAGESSAGVVDLGNGFCCVFKMGTHNHPSGIDPYHGAATCVGDVLRDVLTMGARPISVFNSLRFGDTIGDGNRWLLKGVSDGINEYCAQIGVPHLGGDVKFHESYNTNPLVNIMVIGLVTRDRLLWQREVMAGDYLYLMGAPTGNDGVYGGSEEYQIPQGDGLLARKMMDAFLQLCEKGVVVRAENLDMAGIVCACANLGSQLKKGVTVDLDNIPLQTPGMLDEEILLSRTQERMLLVVPKKNRFLLEEIIGESGIICTCVGEINEGDHLSFYHGSSCVVDLPLFNLVMGYGAPEVEQRYEEEILEHQLLNLEAIPEPDDYWKVINKMVKNPNVVVNHSFGATPDENGQYSPSDAMIVLMDSETSSLCFAVEGNSVFTHNNPFIGAQINMAKSIRSIVCSGGKPLALNDCLNFGSPLEENVFSQFVQSIKGISQACSFFNIPVAGGNVSFFNESSVRGKRQPILPTPVIGMMGLIPKKENHMSYIFRKKGDMIFLIGRSRNDVSGSQYLESIHNISSMGVPYFNLMEEKNINGVVTRLIDRQLICSAHSVGMGGLFFSLLESAIPLGWGFDITSPAEVRTDAFLFGEAQGRVIVSVTREHEDDFVDFMMESNVPFSTLGHVTKGELRIDDISYGFVEEYRKKYNRINTL